MCLDLPKPTINTRNGKECFSSPINSSINKLTNYHNTQKLSGLIFLWLVSEAYQMSMSAQVFIDYHCLACTGSHLAEDHHLAHS